MPALDGTGPMGKGPATGRGFGNCQRPNDYYDTVRPGLGFRHRYNPRRRRSDSPAGEPISREEEINILENELSSISDRISQLKKINPK